jgi:RNA polymerase sigma-70 factor
LERLYAESGARAFAISKGEFSTILDDVLKRSSLGNTADFLKTLRVKDLVLARACAQGNESAWDCFLGSYREKLYLAAAAIAKDQATGRELADSLYAELFGTRVKEDGRRVSKLESFMGRGSLEGWLRTLLAQEYINRLRNQRRLVSFDDALETPDRAETSDPSLPVQHEALTKATDASLSSLNEEERFLLAAYYLDERTLAEIGRILGAHESTVSRRLEKITARLRKEIVVRLRKEGIAKRAAAEMMELDVRDLGVNVREALAQERRG